MEFLEMVEDYILLSIEHCAIKHSAERLKDKWDQSKKLCLKTIHRPKLFINNIKNHLNNN